MSGDVIFRGDTDFRLWNSIDSSMSDAIVNYTGSFSVYGSISTQFLVTDLDLINTIADVSYVEYATVTNSQRTGPGDNINALDVSNIDNGSNDGWNFVFKILDSLESHTSDTPTLTTGSLLSIDDSSQDHSSDLITLTTWIPGALSIDDSSQDHTSDLITLTTWAPSVLLIDDSSQGHTSDQILVWTPDTLSVSDSIHDHSSDQMTLVTDGPVDLAIGDSINGHQSDRITLTTTTPVPPSDILIYRDLQIIDRHVNQPPDYPIRTVVCYSEIPQENVFSLSVGVGWETGGHFGTQHILRGVGTAPSTWYGGVTPYDSPGPLYLQHAATTTKFTRAYVRQYELEPVEVAAEEIGDDLPPVKVKPRRKPKRKLRRQ